VSNTMAGYMAPEKAKGEGVDHRADVYGVGAVVYRCLTRRAPFSGPDHLYAMVHVAAVQISQRSCSIRGITGLASGGSAARPGVPARSW